MQKIWGHPWQSDEHGRAFHHSSEPSIDAIEAVWHEQRAGEGQVHAGSNYRDDRRWTNVGLQWHLQEIRHVVPKEGVGEQGLEGCN